MPDSIEVNKTAEVAGNVEKIDDWEAQHGKKIAENTQQLTGEPVDVTPPAQTMPDVEEAIKAFQPKHEEKPLTRHEEDVPEQYKNKENIFSRLFPKIIGKRIPTAESVKGAKALNEYLERKSS